MTETAENIVKQELLSKSQDRWNFKWESRWTVLQSYPFEKHYYLYRYKSENVLTNPTSSTKIDGATEVDIYTVADNGSEVMFYIENKKIKEKCIFKAQSTQKRDEWIQCLKQAIDSLTSNEEEKKEDKTNKDLMLEYNAKIEEMKKQLNDIKQQNEKLVIESNELSEQNKELLGKYDDVTKEKHEYKQKINVMIEEEKSITNNLENERNKNEQLLSKYDAINNDKDKLIQQIKQIEQESNATKREIESLTKQSTEKDAEIQQKINQLNEIQNQLNNKINESNQRQNELNEKTNELKVQQKDLDDKTNELDRLQNELDIIKAQKCYDPTKKLLVAIKSNHHNNYWCVTGNDKEKINCGAHQINDCEIFEVHPLNGNGNKVAFKSYKNKKWVQIKQDNNGCGIHARASNIGTWEKFQLSVVDKNKNLYGIKCDNNKFIRSSDKSWIVADRNNRTSHETFVIVPLFVFS